MSHKVRQGAQAAFLRAEPHARPTRRYPRSPNVLPRRYRRGHAPYRWVGDAALQPRNYLLMGSSDSSPVRRLAPVVVSQLASRFPSWHHLPDALGELAGAAADVF